MKKIKRIIAIVLLILVILAVGYTAFTCSRTAEILNTQGEQIYEED